MPPTPRSVIPNERRRLFLRYTLASVAAVAVAGVAAAELANHGVLPGKGILDRIDGACSVTDPDLIARAPPGPQYSGAFYSAARRRAVGYTIAASAADFAADDAVTHAAALAGVSVRVAVGHADPFYPGVQALARVLPKDAVVDFAGGCHDDSFFTAQEPPSLGFLAMHLAAG